MPACTLALATAFAADVTPAAGDFGDRPLRKASRGGHAYLVIAGLRFDTSGRGESGPRWRTEPRSARRYVARHARGL
jgi:hypothetical protein